MTSFGNKTQSEEVVEAFASRIQGRTFLITGTSANGIGAAAAIALARAEPEHIILVGRSKAKVDPVIEEIAAVNPKVKATFVQCELSDFDSVRKAGAEILDNKDIAKIDAILNNAGVMAVTEYTKDKQGYELQLSSNHLGHFLLTSIIIPKVLAAGAGSRIVNVTSRGHSIGPFRFDDYNFSDGNEYEPWTAYGQSKTANILFSVELSRRLADKGIKAFSVHPGGILETGLATHLDLERLKDIPAIAKRNNGKSGAYVKDCQIAEALDYATDAQNAQRLWRLSEELVGQKFDI